MTTVVGIDSSLTAAGIAAIEHPSTAPNPNTPRLNTVGERGARDATIVDRATRVHRQFERIIRAMPASVRLVVVEGLPVTAPNPSTASLFQDRAALLLRVVGFLAAKRIPVVEVNPATLKLWATGNGKADKAQVVAAMRELWPYAQIRNDNEADALGLATIGCQQLRWYAPELIHHHGPRINWPRELSR